MRRLETEVLMIGGGSTGTGVARDAAMRGFRTVLVEKRDLTHGTTGRYHGLLHSGGRYAVKDPESANECIAENHVLRHIMPHCLEVTGGLFVITPWDDPAYGDRFRFAFSHLLFAIGGMSLIGGLLYSPIPTNRAAKMTLWANYTR